MFPGALSLPTDPAEHASPQIQARRIFETHRIVVDDHVVYKY